MLLCDECRNPLYKIECEGKHIWYCADCDKEVREDDAIEGDPACIRVDRLLQDEQCLLVGVDNKFYIGVIKHDDGTYHIDVHTPMGIFEEFDICPEGDDAY